MFSLDLSSHLFVGPGGTLAVPPEDEVSRKFAMLIEGECGDLGPLQAARKYGYCKQRYFQLRHLFLRHGALALANRKRGPKTQYRRTEQVVRQIIRLRFLDPDMSAAVIAQKIRQLQHPLSTSSVERVIAAYGLQKKTLPADHRPARDPDAQDQAQGTRGAHGGRRSRTGHPSTAGQ
jgi:hypothetical protein